MRFETTLVINAEALRRDRKPTQLGSDAEAAMSRLFQPYQRPLGQYLTIAVLALSLTSCKSEGVELYPVRGTVLFQNKPAEGATIVFVSVRGDSALRPSGAVSADGSFTLSTYPLGGGAPAGEYAVVVTWYPPNARELDNPTAKLPARYADAGTSGLKAVVNTGPTKLEPFRLTK
jgi:hypothetical protein